MARNVGKYKSLLPRPINILRMPKEIKKLQGYSGSKISLMQIDDKLFVRKQGNIERNFEKLATLNVLGYPVPKIINKQGDVLDMEYIHGLDIRSYLLTNNPARLVNFIVETIEKFKLTSKPKNYYDTFYDKLLFVDADSYLPFTRNELLSKLPKDLEQSVCHGDFTLENIIYGQDDEFHLIDVSTGEYDSWMFDLAKMRQDLDGKWFIRNNPVMLDVKLQAIKHELEQHYPQAFDDNLYILMLLRVYSHAQPNTSEHEFLLKEINRLWK